MCSYSLKIDNPDELLEFKGTVRKLMYIRGMTQKQLADEIGFSLSSVKLWFDGRDGYTSRFVTAAIADYFEMTS